MSAPRTKRQYKPSSTQPTITSHFRPVPPSEEIQANLLSVGMRVRKSVPEGYKTHKTLSASLPFTSSAPAQLQHRITPSLVRTASGGYGRELTPFCGLHKVGGWSMQGNEGEEEEEQEYDCLPGLSISQGTISSSQGSYGGGFGGDERTSGNLRKRGYEEDVEDDMDAFFDEMDAVKEERPIARMRGSAVNVRKMGGSVAVVRVEDDDDFEEAAFLAPVEGMDVDL